MKYLAILLACLAAACSHANPGASTSLTQLQALGRDTACSGDQQCRTLPVGAKPCGGPESYLAYSTAKNSEQKARALAETYKKERLAAHKAAGLASDCRFLMDPGALCRAGSCQLRTGAEAVIE